MIRKPDFENVLKVLDGQKPNRPTLFEFFLNWDLFVSLTGKEPAKDNPMEHFKLHVDGFHKAGYDYCTLPFERLRTLTFPKKDMDKKSTISLNDGTMITDRKTFEEYPWPDAENVELGIYDEIEKILPDGMKIIGHGPGGILENVVSIVGYENLCIMSMTDEELTRDIFDAMGSRYVRYYEQLAQVNCIGACIVNDDWGFKNQTMLSPDMMRAYVIPWHKKVVAQIHKAAKPAILHSCGNLDSVMDDIIDDIQFDGKHSYEDGIIPVEQAYEKWGDRIAVLGGIDVDFLVRATPEAIYERAKKLVRMDRGGYALGSGNSIPNYIPKENYFAMTRAALECN